MAESHVITGLKTKRARIAGEIIQHQEIVAHRTKELLAIDAVIRLFSPDCDPDMIAPIRPASRGLFFQYRELPRLCLDLLRRAKGPITLNPIVDQIMDAKGFPADPRLRRHVYCSTHATLKRMAHKGLVRRVLDEPDQWWELAR
jgi:hypothetical protein